MKKIFSAAFSAALILCGCSSSPKRAMIIDNTYHKAATRYENANTELTLGNTARAGDHLFQAYNIATSIDNAELLCRICIAASTYKLSIDKERIEDKYFSSQTADSFLQEARGYANWSQDKTLLAATDIYQVKTDLQNKKTDFDSYKKILDAAEKPVSSDKYFTGYLYRVYGDLAVAQNNYASAADWYTKAADVHTKNRYLYEISLDYYYAARAYSLAQNKGKAIDAIQKALKYDRDAENSAAIVADYRAYAKILLRGNPTEQEKESAQNATKRAKEIETAMERSLAQ